MSSNFSDCSLLPFSHTGSFRLVDLGKLSQASINTLKIYKSMAILEGWNKNQPCTIDVRTCFFSFFVAFPKIQSVLVIDLDMPRHLCSWVHLRNPDGLI